MSSEPTRLRFAPSPTGFLHIGGVRTALFNWLYAKQTGGSFILRLEDTDRERFVVEGVEQIVEALDWFGLRPDEGYWEGNETGHVGPYIQSKRLPQYENYIDQLLQSGLAYRSLIGEAEYSALRQTAQSQKQAFVYRQTMEPRNTNTEGKFPIRLNVLACLKKLGLETISWQDHGGLIQEVDPATIEDFILLKSDGFPTYNFANVIDDHLMQITHIMRGNEFISSTPKHALLFDCLGWERPIWVHLPLIVGNDGSKLSKRHGDSDALQYRDKGYLPEAVLNFLVMLGWNDGTEQEVFSIEELIEKFSIDRIQKSPAKFDIERLNWLNGLYIRDKLSVSDYLDRATAELTKSGMVTESTDKQLIKQAVLLERDRIKFFSELPAMVEFFFSAPEVDRAILTKKHPPLEAKQLLEKAMAGLNDDVVSETDIELALRRVVKQSKTDLKAGELFQLIRIAITGRTAAPGLFETIATMGVSETKSRLQSAIAILS